MNLSDSTRQQYLALQSCLDDLQTSTDSDLAITLHAELQTGLQDLLASLSTNERQLLQRYNTEIFKELQLLSPDLMRLPLLKPGTKQEQVLSRVHQRCDRLKGYLSTLLDSAV